MVFLIQFDTIASCVTSVRMSEEQRGVNAYEIINYFVVHTLAVSERRHVVYLHYAASGLTLKGFHR